MNVGGGTREDLAAVHNGDAAAHDEAADRHMKAAVLWRDLGQVQRAVLEVKFAMAERQLAQLERDRSKLEPQSGTSSEGRRAVPSTSVKGAVELVYAENLWHVLVDEDAEACSAHPFRNAAMAVAHEVAQRTRRELVVRGRDGTVREHVSYRESPLKQRVIYRRPELRRA